MDRQIVYPGQIPLETDLLNTNKFAMVALARLTAVITGQSTYLSGLSCTPTLPASLAVTVGEGQIYALEKVDCTPYSSLPADTANTIMKQGLYVSPVSHALDAPAEAGQSIDYLIQAAYRDEDSGPVVLPYYNAADPAVAFSGPGNAGNAQNTVRTGVCEIKVKPGIPAISGTQVPPEPDTGYTPAWVITVSYGATTIHTGDIRPADGAPFLPHDGLVTALQQSSMTFGPDIGTANHCLVNFIPAIRQVRDGTRLYFRVNTTNTGPARLKVNALPESVILTPIHEELTAGLLVSGHVAEVEWHGGINAWILRSSSASYTRQECDERFLPRSGGHFWQGLSNWYYECPGEGKQMIIQGGTAFRNENSTGVVFPIVFPDRCLNVQISLRAINGRSIQNFYVSNIEKHRFEIIAGSGEWKFSWLAFGI